MTVILKIRHRVTEQVSIYRVGEVPPGFLQLGREQDVSMWKEATGGS